MGKLAGLWSVSLTIVVANGLEIPCFPWNLTVHYRVYMRPVLVPVCSKLNEVRILIAYFIKVSFKTVAFQSY